MFENKVFIVKLAAINRLAPRAVVVGEVTPLTHELGDDAMEAAAFKAKALLVRTQAAEILYKRYGKLITTDSWQELLKLNTLLSIQSYSHGFFW